MQLRKYFGFKFVIKPFLWQDVTHLMKQVVTLTEGYIWCFKIGPGVHNKVYLASKRTTNQGTHCLKSMLSTFVV